MNMSIPFLYLPDAISLALLVVALILLRRSAIEHFRQELLKIRHRMVVYCCDIGFPLRHPAYLHIHDEITLLDRIAQRISPAHLFFIRRVCNEAFTNESLRFLPCKPDRLEEKLDKIGNKRLAEKLRTTQLEINLTLGSLYLLGSLSGWMLSSRFLYKIAFRKIPGHPKKKSDKRIDLAERFISRIGYRMLLLISITTKATKPLIPSSVRRDYQRAASDV
jgi:hypothetical protein